MVRTRKESEPARGPHLLERVDVGDTWRRRPESCDYDGSLWCAGGNGVTWGGCGTA